MLLFIARNVIINKLQFYRPQNHNRLFSLSFVQNSSAKKQTEEELAEDKPIQFSTSRAAKWRAEVSRSGVEDQAPWFQPYVISLSLSIFMLYFFYFREESDIDTEFEKNLYDRISGLEEKQLEIVHRYNVEQNLPVNDIERRLEEIRKEKT